MERNLGELASEMGLELSGDAALVIRGVATLKDAREGDLSFFVNVKYRGDFASTKASAVVVPFGTEPPPGKSFALLFTLDPYLTFARIVGRLYPERHPATGVSPLAFVDPTAQLGEGVAVGPFAYVGAGAEIGSRTVLYPLAYVGEGARLGEGCVVFPHVYVHAGVEVGNRVRLQPGAVIGSDGFGYARDEARWEKIPQVGTVVLGDDVEIGAGATIDRSSLGRTVIGRGTKIDNLVMIAHSVEVGEDCAFAAQVGIAGSTRVGDRVQLAGQTGVIGHVKIGDDVILGAKSGVHTDIPAGFLGSGQPPVEHKKFLKIKAVTLELPEFRQHVRRLERRIEALERERSGGMKSAGGKGEEGEG